MNSYLSFSLLLRVQQDLKSGCRTNDESVSHCSAEERHCPEREQTSTALGTAPGEPHVSEARNHPAALKGCARAPP